LKRLLHFEHRDEPLAPVARFSSRLKRNARWALGIISVALAIGMAGYMGFESMGLVDAFANAAMILSGMGPLTPLKTEGGKIFAGLYAIASGLLIFAIAGLVLAPVFHRLLHRFHMEARTPKD
jgi:TRAP-type C4-dicarboxylate transport system permease small subunit